MPTTEQHVRKADANSAFADELDLATDARIDWALISKFYAAMHYIEAYFAKNNIHLNSHQTRDSYVGRDGNLRAIFREYSDLKFYGFNARYAMNQFKKDDVVNKSRPAYEKLRKHVKDLL